METYQKRNKKDFSSAFTLIELLVVIAVIALLASIILIALGKSRSKARDAQRRADLVQMATALELYYNVNGSYPSTSKNVESVSAACGTVGTTSGASGYIPNLAPTYIGTLPVDPLGALPSGCGRVFTYESDGKDYLLMSLLSVENCSNISTDPMRNPDPAFASECDYAIYTPGAGGNNWF